MMNELEARNSRLGARGSRLGARGSDIPGYSVCDLCAEIILQYNFLGNLSLRSTEKLVENFLNKVKLKKLKISFIFW